MKQQDERLIRVVVCGMLMALDVVLTRFASVNLWDRRIGFSFLAVAAAAYLYGPLAAALTHGCADFLGAVLFPTGAYFPGFTLTAALIGGVYGLCFYRRDTLWRTSLGVVAAQLVGSIGLNTLWISLTNHTPYLAVLPGRLIQAAIMTGVQVVCVPLVLRGVKRATRTQVMDKR